MLEIHNVNAVDFFSTYTRKDGDVIITDPPFNVGYKYDVYKDKTGREEWLDLLAEICKPPCVVILYPEMMFEFSQRIGMLPSKCVSWVYNTNTARQHRMIAWFGIKPDFSKVGQPYKEPNHKKNRERVARGEMARLYDWWEVQQIRHHVAEKLDHPCQMPLEIMRRVVGITPCKRVLDPFAGSGTTLSAASMWGKEAIGTELSPNYCEIIKERLGLI